MQSTAGFTGLTMPVFTAFGWMGEENAIKFALSQLEAFIQELHGLLPRSTQEKFPYFGLSTESQSVYLAAAGDVESDIYIAFNARPLSLEIQLVLSAPELLIKALRLAAKDLHRFHRLVTELGPEWSLRLQQSQVNEESGEVVHYQDLYKDTVIGLDEAALTELINKATYLSGEEQWTTPLTISRRLPSEQAATMGTAITKVMSDELTLLMPLISFLTGRVAKKQSRSKAKAKPVAAAADILEADTEEEEISADEGFTHVAVLKALHIRRGFINLTSEHWPFFALNARATTREVTVYYNGIYDKESMVWRLVPDDQARIVLSPALHQWLEEYFDPEEQIQVTARRLTEDDIQLTLAAVP